jgi:hypothetical protein
MVKNKTITRSIQEEIKDFKFAPLKIKVLVIIFILCALFILYNEVLRIPALKENIAQLEKEKGEKTAEIQRLETLLTPFRIYALEKFPSEDIHTALKRLSEEIKTLEEKTRKTVFSPGPVTKEKMDDGSFVYRTRLTPIGNNVIPIFAIRCQTQNQAEIKVFEVKGPTVPGMSYNHFSKDKTIMSKEFRSLYPGEISVRIVTDKDAGQIKITIDPLQK